MAVIKVASPAGSGMNFALTLLQKSFHNEGIDFFGGGHERSDILEDTPTIVIIRNPVDAIASGSERWVKSSGHLEFKDNSDTLEDTDVIGMVRQIAGEKARYLEFFKDIETLKHVKIFKFESIIHSPDLFLKQVAEHFKIDIPITQRTIQYIKDTVIQSGHENRVPRKKSNVRQLIDDLTKAMFPDAEWKVYLDLADKIDKGLI